MKLLHVVFTSFLLSLSATVFAGATFSHDVDFGDDYLRGGVSAADASSDNNQYIG